MKKLNRFLSFLVLTALVATSSVTSSAKTTVPDGTDSYSSYVTQSQINGFINEEKNLDSMCPWNASTKISKTIPTYNLNNEISGLIVDLANQNKPCGYIAYVLSDRRQPVVSEFCYDGEYTLAGKKVPADIIANKKKLIHVQMLNDLISDGAKITTLNGINVSKSKNEIKNEINNEQTIINTTVSQQENQLATSKAQKIYKDVNVTNALNDNMFMPAVMGEFSHWSKSGCTVICGVNMLNYWTYCRNISDLFTLQDYVTTPRFSIAADKLGARMRTINDAPVLGSVLNGTTYSNGFNGMGAYLSNDVYDVCAGNDYADNPSWSWITRNISHMIPLCLNADVHNFEGDSRYGGHSFFAIGFQETSTGNYIRVVNEWDTSISHFYNYSINGSQVANAWYYRW